MSTTRPNISLVYLLYVNYNNTVQFDLRIIFESCDLFLQYVDHNGNWEKKLACVFQTVTFFSFSQFVI